MTTLKLQISFRVNEQPGKSFFLRFLNYSLPCGLLKIRIVNIYQIGKKEKYVGHLINDIIKKNEKMK